MSKFRSKPVEIEAVQLTAAYIESCLFDGKEFPMGLTFDGWTQASDRSYGGAEFECHSRQGIVPANPNDWIITEPGNPALCYPCAPDVFAQRWEPVDAATPPA